MANTTLVTGGAGFIGSSLVRALVARGDKVRVIDDLSSGKRDNLADVEGVEFIAGSILDPEALARAVDGVNTVFHQAAIPSVPRSLAAPLPSHEANATGTLRVLEAARAARVRRVVYAGSSSAYGDTPTLPKVETMPTAPLSPYAVSKLTGEHYCRVYASAFGLETVVLRYFNVFGPRQDPASQYSAVIPKWIRCGLTGEPMLINGDGLQSRDFCFIDNAVEANLLAATAPGASGGVFNVACGARTVLKDIPGMIEAAIRRPVRVEHGPGRVGDVKHSLADIRAAREILGYTAGVSFEVGLARTIAWYVDRR
jgi:UDP-glucose 4-epimerase